MTSNTKTFVKKFLSLPGVRIPGRMMMRDCALIFMLHRFSDPENGVEGFSAAILRRMLELLRRDKTRVLSLLELIDLIESGAPLNGAVVFTMDDGYREQGTVAGPLFAEFDCPVTLFLTTGFIDGALWPWWDKIEYIFQNSQREGFADEQKFILSCKEASEAERQHLIEETARQAEVSLPHKPPARYTPLTWDEVRALERPGMDFAPHSVTHPILSRTSAEQSSAEIRDSWQRVKQNVTAPVPVFAYPVGREQDFGEREIATIKSLGLRAAVTAQHRYAAASRDGLFALPRLVFPGDDASLGALLSGIEHLRGVLR